MDITVISTSSDIVHSLDPTRYFGIMLTKSLSIIRMLHWYATDFNTHEILGDLYSDLSNLFDKLQEEIIGTSRISQVLFPSFSPDTFNDTEIEQYQCNCDGLTDVYNLTTTKIIAILESNEFSNYIQSVSSGLNNTKEDIISRINKSNYLLSMVKP
jgi:hypothetical protein